MHMLRMYRRMLFTNVYMYMFVTHSRITTRPTIGDGNRRTSREVFTYMFCMCIHTFVHIYIYIHMFIWRLAQRSAAAIDLSPGRQIYTYIYIYICVYIYTCIYKCGYIHICIYTHVCDTYIYRYIYAHIHIYRCIHTCIYIPRKTDLFLTR